MSDCGAVGIIHDEQGYAKSAEDAVADVLHAGIYLGISNPLFKFLLSFSCFALLCDNSNNHTVKSWL